eukprot:TRINITY_DN478_c0_g1_i1.p1 TRINITY_DN478_c0_g1~~TRINITY_DN478_c0_g1_i1.p1  ORF type:complete len:886 (+),score=162.30 TRINITY_DN478_c0_g1_i1:39-2696(+)
MVSVQDGTLVFIATLVLAVVVGAFLMQQGKFGSGRQSLVEEAQRSTAKPKASNKKKKKPNNASSSSNTNDQTNGSRVEAEIAKPAEEPSKKKKKKKKNKKNMTTLHELFTTPLTPDVSDYGAHFKAKEDFGDLYYLYYFMMGRSKHTLDTNCKVCVMLVALNDKRIDVAEEILRSEWWGIHEILTLCRSLDRKRRKRTLEATCEKKKKSSKESLHNNAATTLTQMNQNRRSGNLFHNRENRQGVDQFYNRGAFDNQNEKTVFGGLRGKYSKPVYKSYFMVRGYMNRSERRSSYKYAQHSQEADSLSNIPVQELTLSGGRAAFINQWWAMQSVSVLYHVLLEKSFYPWKRSAELLHPNPATLSDPNFLKCIFSSSTQRPQPVEYCMRLRRATMSDVASLRNHQPPLSYLVKKFNLRSFDDKVRSIIANYSPIHQALKYYKALACFDVQEILHQRLEDEIDTIIERSYGELVDYAWNTLSSKGGFLDKLISIADSKIQLDPWWYDTPSLILCDDTMGRDYSEVAQTYAGLLSAITVGDLYFVGHKRTMMHEPASFKDALLLGFLSKRTTVAEEGNNLLSKYIKLCETRKTFYKSITLFMKTTEDIEQLKTAIAEYRKSVNENVKITILSFGDAAVAPMGPGIAIYKHVHIATPVAFDNVISSLRLASENSEVLVTLSPILKGLSLQSTSQQIETWSRSNIIDVFTEILENNSNANPNKKSEIAQKILPALKKAIQCRLTNKVSQECFSSGDFDVLLEDCQWWCSPYHEKPSRSMVPLTGYNVLPPLVLDLILTCLPEEDLKTTSLACRTWYMACLESCLDRTLSTSQSAYSPELLILEERGLVSLYGKRRCYGALMRSGGNVDRASAALMTGIKTRSKFNQKKSAFE